MSTTTTTTTTTTEDDNDNAKAKANNNDLDDDDDGKLPRIINSKTVGSTKWLKLETLSYKDQEGKNRLWDYATRTTKQSKNSTDAVVIIPLLKYCPYANKDGDDTNSNDSDDSVFDTLLVEQYRPPLGRTTLEFPAGLIDKNETPIQAALRELREETGYVGESCKIVPVVSNQVCMSPGICDEVVQCVVVIVDLNNPYNNDQHELRIEPNPDDGEYIKIHRVSLKDGFQKMLDNKTKQQQNDGDDDDDGNGKLLSPMAIQGLYLFAMGLEIGKSMK
jgi:8-oxo-dGTP pyrophosphatase MutT (NUDIX family)